MEFLTTKPRGPFKGTQRKLIVAIDIGTTFSGASWCFLEPKQHPKYGAVLRWPKQAVPDAKVPTAIFYDNEGKARAFGAEVEDDEVLNKAGECGWVLVEWFKLQLRPRSLHTIHELPPIPNHISLDQIYTDYLHFIGTQFRSSFRIAYANGDTLWNELEPSMELVLSIPNGWEGGQQERMRRAAIAAGIVDAKGGARVKFVTEAEASILYTIDTGSVQGWLAPNSHVVLCDCGGGTVDITRYKIVSDKPSLHLEESAAATCHLAGGVIVTQHARDFLKDHLQDTLWDNPSSLEQMAQYFDKTTKNKFTGEGWSYVYLGDTKSNEYEEKGISRNRLKLSAATMSSFFDGCIEDIKHGISTACEDASGQQISAKVILVGGFASSPYVFSQLEKWAERQGIKIIRPATPAKAVANGALVWSLDSPVRARVAKWHYGTDVQVVYDARDSEHQLYADRKVIAPGGQYYVPKAWDDIVQKDTKLVANKEYRALFTAELSEDTTEFEREETIYIYRSEESPPSFMGDPGAHMSFYRSDILQVGKDAELKPGFEALCTVKGDLRQVFTATKSQVSVSGVRFRKISFEVCLLLGATELSARLRWQNKGKYVYGPATIVYE
ncbi:hypothetical protein C8F01DRAFT_1043782 [Mycena amicta]|nr:hypothetical protein C8F01DRAFT_1043782 [Mycena amicta]